MENSHHDLKHQNGTKPFVIILDDLDFTFSPSDLCNAAAMWNSGATDREIADAIRPRGSRQAALDEVTLLLMHLRRRKHIKHRKP
ncbi:MAG: hypothetical protein SCK57_12205 [Bacillota bacterium]|nr:hypothetical protein [Bacillota bacterium]MDW7678416.1 hypothetical protein [Bacillota bacterium]